MESASLDLLLLLAIFQFFFLGSLGLAWPLLTYLLGILFQIWCREGSYRLSWALLALNGEWNSLSEPERTSGHWSREKK